MFLCGDFVQKGLCPEEPHVVTDWQRSLDKAVALYLAF